MDGSGVANDSNAASSSVSSLDLSVVMSVPEFLKSGSVLQINLHLVIDAITSY